MTSPLFAPLQDARIGEIEKSQARDPILRPIMVMAAVLGLAVSALPLAIAQPPADVPLTRLRTWALEQREIYASEVSPTGYKLRLEMAFVSGSRWAPDVILHAAKHAVTVLAQCDVWVSEVQLHEFDAPPPYRSLFTPQSREFARRARLSRPAVFFVDETLQRPAFDAEAVGRGNAKTRPEMTDTVWITAGTRDLPIALAHELVHVLSDSGAHSPVPGNLMGEETAPGNTQLGPEQCRRIVEVGLSHGLLDRGTNPLR